MMKFDTRSVAAAWVTAAFLASGLPASADPAHGYGRTGNALTIRHHRSGRWAKPDAGYQAGVAAPLVVPLDPTGTVAFQTPFFAVATPDGGAGFVRVPHYQGPDGTYDSQADFVNDINGTPCGQDCVGQSLARWGYVPAF